MKSPAFKDKNAAEEKKDAGKTEKDVKALEDVRD